MGSRSITCNNNNGYSMRFDNTGFTPFILAHVDGIYGMSNKVIITDNTMIDGGSYQSSIAEVRNIILTLLDKPDNFYNVDNREILYALFSKGERGTLTYEENGKERVIDYYVESARQEKGKGSTNPITVSLLCPDPFFYEKEYHTVEMADWERDFEFEHNFVAIGEELGHREAILTQNIVNATAAEKIGLIITMEAQGSVLNPSVTKVETNETIKVGSSSNPFTLTSGEQVVITTATGNKHVYLDADGVRSEINGYMTEDSSFIQLMRGDNTIGFSADSGVENLTISIQYRYKFEGG